MMSVIPYAFVESASEELYEVEDRIICGGLTHYGGPFLEKCFHDNNEFEQSLNKAAIALHAANEPVSRHFRTIFLCGDELTRDWLISDLGLRLLLLNADVSNPLVSRLLLRILSMDEEH